MAFSKGQVVKVTHEGSTFLAVVDDVGADSVAVSVMVPANVQHLVVPVTPTDPSDPLIEA